MFGEAAAGRLAPLFLGVVVGAAMAVAFLSTGTTSAPSPIGRQHPGLAEANKGEVPAARSYGELEHAPWWRKGEPVALDQLPMADGRDFVGTVADALEHRARRRAFDGAPPVIPHGGADQPASACLACHDDGMAFAGGQRAPRICHEPLSSCGQCHVAATTPIPGVDAAAAEVRYGPSAFEPLVAQTGRPAFVGAPPPIPHATAMRDRCLSCHGAGGLRPLLTQHPARAQCRQCHVASASLDQHAFGVDAPW